MIAIGLALILAGVLGFLASQWAWGDFRLTDLQFDIAAWAAVAIVAVGAIILLIGIAQYFAPMFSSTG